MATRTYQNEKGNPGPRPLRLRFVWLLFIYNLHAGALWRNFNSVCSAIIILRYQHSPASNLCSIQEVLPPRQLTPGLESSSGARRLRMYSSVHYRAPQGKGVTVFPSESP